jgi:hypothetical protein
MRERSSDGPADLQKVRPRQRLCYLSARGNGITFSKIAADLAAQWVIGKTGPLQDLFAF